MALIIHNVDLPNSGNGDELREAFVNQNTMNAELYESKVDKVLGKDLSDQNYTIEEKNKLAGIAVGAEVNVQANLLQNDTTADDYVIGKEIITAQPTNTSQLINDGEDGTSAFITAEELTGLIDENENFVKKTDSVSYTFGQSGTAIELELPANGQSFFALTNPSLVSVAGFSLANITGNPSAEVPYIGKPYFIANNTGNNVTLLHDDTAENQFFFISGADIVIPSTGIIELRYDPDGINEVFKSWSEVDLSTKADLVGGKVPSSQLPSYVDDVLEYANLAAFPTTGESGKIYLALDTNKTYRWSGSAYVQIGGSSEEIWNTSRYANWRILKAEALGGNQGAIGFTNNFGFTNIGTVSLKPSTYNTGNFINTIRRIGLTSAATAGSSTQRAPNMGIPCSTKSGFYFCADTISEDAATVATAADFVGLATLAAGGNTEPSTSVVCILLAYDSTDTNMQIMHNDNTGTCTKIDLGTNFPARTNATDLYRLELYCATNGVEINYRVTRLNTGDQSSGTLTTNIPTSALPLTLGFWRGNRSTALAVTKSFSQITIATPY